MKERVSVSLEKELLKTIDYLIEKKFEGIASRSSVIEYYLKKGMEGDVRKIREEEASKGARFLR